MVHLVLTQNILLKSAFCKHLKKKEKKERQNLQITDVSICTSPIKSGAYVFPQLFIELYNQNVSDAMIHNPSQFPICYNVWSTEKKRWYITLSLLAQIAQNTGMSMQDYYSYIIIRNNSHGKNKNMLTHQHFTLLSWCMFNHSGKKIPGSLSCSSGCSVCSDRNTLSHIQVTFSDSAECRILTSLKNITFV